jgi:radical SAM protein with 4Fe4S-binding SPASM domain
MTLQVAADERARNLALRELELEAGAEELKSRPTRVWFALTGRCNLACLHCPRIAGVEPDIDMELELFRQVRDQVLPYADEVDFGGNNLGEQIIHPAFASVLEEIRSVGCRILLTTNATKLDANLSEVLARAGVRLSISVEGVGKTYEQVRRASWDKLVASLRAYQEAMARHPDAKPALEFVMTVFAGNVHELPDLIRIAKELGADKVHVHHLLPKTKDQQLQSLFFHRSTANAAFAESQATATGLGIKIELPTQLDCGSIVLKKDFMTAEVQKKALEPCYLPWTSANILENGDVLPCCVGGPLIMGNLKKSSFDDIWNGPAYRRLRRTVNSKRPNPTCATCALRSRGATEDSYTFLLPPSLSGRVKGMVKSYLVRSKRKKVLQGLIKVRDGVNRALARI